MVKLLVFFVAWKDPSGGSWFPIGRVTFNGSQYTFNYTKGAVEAFKTGLFTFAPSFELSQSLNWTSDEIFPFLANRIVSKGRPDYEQLLSWLMLPNTTSELALLLRTEGRRTTDTFEVFPLPEKDELEKYEIVFFAHAIRFLSSRSEEAIQHLRSGERLLYMPDPQNTVDSNAIALRTTDDAVNPKVIVGYFPRFLVQDTRKLVKLTSSAGDVAITVEKVNEKPAPQRFRLLCRMEAPWPKRFRPFAYRQFRKMTFQDLREVDQLLNKTDSQRNREYISLTDDYIQRFVDSNRPTRVHLRDGRILEGSLVTADRGLYNVVPTPKGSAVIEGGFLEDISVGDIERIE